MKPTHMLDNNMYAVCGRSYWQTLLSHYQSASALSEYLQSLPVRDFELIFLLYAALRHQSTAPFGHRYLWPAFLQLAYEFALPVPLLDELVNEGVHPMVTSTPDFGAGHRPDLESVVRECKERFARSRFTPGKASDHSDAPQPREPESLEDIKAYLNTLKNA